MIIRYAIQQVFAIPIVDEIKNDASNSRSVIEEKNININNETNGDTQREIISKEIQNINI